MNYWQILTIILCDRTTTRSLSIQLWYDEANSIKLFLRLLKILVQPLSVIRGFLKYVIIKSKNWTKNTYIALVIKEATTHQTQ